MLLFEAQQAPKSVNLVRKVLVCLCILLLFATLLALTVAVVRVMPALFGSIAGIKGQIVASLLAQKGQDTIEQQSEFHDVLLVILFCLGAISAYTFALSRYRGDGLPHPRNFKTDPRARQAVAPTDYPRFLK